MPRVAALIFGPPPIRYLHHINDNSSCFRRATAQIESQCPPNAELKVINSAKAMTSIRNTFFALITGLLLTAATLAQQTTKYESTAQSRIWVDGTSTIHDWTCEVGNVSADIAAEDGFSNLSKAVITVKSSALECKNGTMNKKALSALNAKKHPTIRFAATSNQVTTSGDDVKIATTGQLELAGVTKTVKTTVAGKIQSDGSIRFTGTLPIKMSDYGIDQPTAMLGTVKTGNDVKVRFDIVVQPSN